MKRRYKEGDWFRIPLPGGDDAIGVIARADRSRLYGYFFAVNRADPVTPDCLKQLRPKSALLERFFGGAGLEERRWPILATSLAFDSQDWPAPEFTSPVFATPEQLERELEYCIAGIPPETPLAVYEVRSPVDAPALAVLNGGGRVQFSEPLSPDDYEHLAAYLQAHTNVELRVHGDWPGGFDASLLRGFPGLRALILDTNQVRNAETLSGLSGLVSFRAGAGTVMNLTPLNRIETLRKLDVQGIDADVRGLEQLATLAELHLMNTPVVALASLACKERLHTLALRHGPYDLSQLASLPALERLDLQDLRLDRLPDLSSNPKLHSLVLRDLRLVRDLTALLTASGLRRLTIEAMPQLEVFDFEPLLRRGPLDALLVNVGSKTKSREIYRMLRRG